jgi:diacylglycerol kinase family enzyme
MKFIITFEIEKYSALILVGGDGTFHESVNGLLKRSDKK